MIDPNLCSDSQLIGDRKRNRKKVRDQMRVRFRCPVRRNDWRSANYCLPDFLFDRSPGNKK